MKKLISLLAVLVLLTALCLPVQAAEPQLDHVTDSAGLLTDEQWETLEEKSWLLSKQYQCGVYIITLDDFTYYVSTDSVYEAAKAIYLEYNLGWGQEKSGVLLLLSMAERDYALIAYGYGNTAFTDFGKDKLAEVFLDDFKEDDWYGGLEDFLEKSESMLKSARAGKPLDVDSDPWIRLVGLLVSIGLGCLLALLVCSLLWEKMKSVSAKTEADPYLRKGSVVFTKREDQFTHRTQTRVKVEKESGSKSGGTTVDRDGFSGKSGKF